MKKIQRFFLNAMIMTATSLLMNAVGVWFNLYISGKIGAEGMGVFQLIMSVYSFTVTFAASGINLASTRLVAEEAASPNGNVKGAMRRCFGYALLFGGAASLFLFFAAPFIGETCLGSVQTVRPLKTMALSMPFIAMSCALNGYFTAVGRVAKSAASQIFEQFLKISLSIVGLTFLMPPGLEYACLAITGSGVIAEGLSFVSSLALYLGDSRGFRRKGAPKNRLTGRLFGIALPMAMSSYLRSGLATVKNLLVPVRLQAGGLATGASFAVFGAVHGIALPVILFPAAFLNSFSSLIVPEIAQRHSRGQSISHLIQRMFALNLCCSIGVCGVLFAFSHEIGAAVSQNPDVGVYIRLLAPVIPVMYLDTAVDCMLKGMDEQLSVMRYNVADAAISMVLVYLLLPVLGIKGYILVIVLSEVFNFSLSLGRLIRVAKFEVDITERVVKPLLCAAISVLAARILSRAGLPLPGSPIGFALLLALVSAGCYLLLLHLAGCDPRRV
ncbi:polysaccharide biosynthesis C-terminal domain-containing protein [Anaerotruncus sp. DFI.9.16]|uniref:oligosaccharide flippase family protein n=1 Tax=Anaerotruncus sp. DFI.9.16 TaxID=2965275 RepID=UPI00210C4D6F|nr:polysaccharide biosynthesis C-terminal domain-containing protein [Anaerotruncus sp. DFI.9.16]MCQ4894814.1 polysaccharide biosynthesis C-terminal domain-containing protein [Anaerotruncus sp. DFI.9.16]